MIIRFLRPKSRTSYHPHHRLCQRPLRQMLTSEIEAPVIGALLYQRKAGEPLSLPLTPAVRENKQHFFAPMGYPGQVHFRAGYGKRLAPPPPLPPISSLLRSTESNMEMEHWDTMTPRVLPSMKLTICGRTARLDVSLVLAQARRTQIN